MQTETMTGRERVSAALSHKETDRIPIDLGGSWTTTVTIPFYERLKRHFQINSPTEVVDRMMQVCKIDERILLQLHVDTRPVFYNPPALEQNREIELGGNRYRDQWGVEWSKPENSYYYDLCKSPLSGPISFSDIRNHPWPEPEDPGYAHKLRERVKKMRSETDCALMLNLTLWILQCSQNIRGYLDWYYDIAGNPRLIEYMVDFMTESMLGPLISVTEAIGDLVDVVIVGDDLGHQEQLCISPESYRRIFRPRHERLLRAIKANTEAQVVWHTCGSVITILDDLIEIGVDAITPVQTTAKDMEPERLKEKFRNRLAFWGGIDTMRVLNNGTADAIRKDVEYKIQTLAPGGGYVLNPTHNVQPDVPVENLLTMIDAAFDYGWFPIKGGVKY